MQHKITFKSKGLNCSDLFYLPNNAASPHNRTIGNEKRACGR